MTLPQLATLLDSLKRPIEEAPRDQRILGVYAGGYTETLVWDEAEQCWFGNYKSVRCNPTHFLPLPAKGPVEFEVVPVGKAERAYMSGLETGAEVARLEGEEE